MRTAVCLLTILASAWLFAGCQVDPLEGCRGDEDCRFGRTCEGGVCVWPSDMDLADQRGDLLDGGPPPDARPDARHDHGGDARADRGMGLCLRSIGPRTVSIALGAVEEIELRLENCGERDIQFDRLAIEAQGDGASLEVVSLPRAGAVIEPGESLPILADLSGDRVGRTAFVLMVNYSADQAQRLDIPLTVIVGDACGAQPLLIADRDGPSSDDGLLRVEFGHQIRIQPADGTLIDRIELAAWPPNSEPVLAQLEAEGVWLLVPDRPGVYRLRTVSLDPAGCSGELEAEIIVENPPGDFAVWVTWAEPLGGMGGAADLDLYVARQTPDGYLWEQSGEAVGPSNQQADFGAPGVFEDNPRYIFDYNDEGWGPEQVRIPAPDGGETLAVGVHAFSIPHGFDRVGARVFLRLDGELLGPYVLDLGSGQFWIVAETQGAELLDLYDLLVDGFPDPGLP